MVIFVMNVPLHLATIANTVNPLLSPWGAYLFQAQLTGGLNSDRGLLI